MKKINSNRGEVCMPSIKPRLVIRTNEDVIEKFSFIAGQENRSMSNLGETLIKKYIEIYEIEHGEILINETKSME